MLQLQQQPMLGGAIHLRYADPLDAVRLACLGARTFRETYEDLLPGDLLESTISEKYGVARQKNELSTPSRYTLLLEKDNNAAIGFAQMNFKAPPLRLSKRNTSRSCIHLEHHYVLKGHLRRGFGSALMEAIEAEARQRGSTVLWLGLMHKNDSALSFYEARGFKCGEKIPFTVAGRQFHDLIMIKEM